MQTQTGSGDALDIGFGLTGNARRVAARGTNPLINVASVPADMWPGGGIYPWIAAETTLEMLSSSTVDAQEGNGAHSVLINGLDGNHAEVAIAVALDGTTPVVLPKKLFRINSMIITDAGRSKINSGDIILRDSSGGLIRAVIKAGMGESQQTQFTVPAGWTLQVTTQAFCYNRVSPDIRSATFVMFIQNSKVYTLSNELSVTNLIPFQLKTVPGKSIPEKTDFGIRCTFVSTDAANLSAGWIGVLRKNF